MLRTLSFVVWAGGRLTAARYLLQVLSMADLVAPTADSVSMLSEAVGAGKPVAVLCSERCKGKVRLPSDHTPSAPPTLSLILS